MARLLLLNRPARCFVRREGAVSKPSTSWRSTRACAALKAHRVSQNAERLKVGERWHDNELVIRNTVDRPMNPSNLYRREFRPLLSKASLGDEGFTFHSLRHTFATTLAANGVYPSTAQKMLAHKDIRMTLAIYTHITD
jgi:integrase